MTEPDLLLAASVERALDDAPAVDTTQIFVHVDGVVVRLAGMVGSRAERFRAQAAALKVDRVTTVIDSLLVPAPLLSSDNDIAQSIEHVLRECLGVGSTSIRAVVRNCVVTLSGVATRAEERLVVQRLTDSIPQIEFIDNRIVLQEAAADRDPRKARHAE